MISYYGEGGDWSPLPTASNVIWSNGCFDLLHIGHLELLKKCRDESDQLFDCVVYVGLDSDDRIQKSKGSKRPINNITSRIASLLSLKYVDGVFVYDTDEELESLICDIKPKKMILGEEYENKSIIGKVGAEEVIFFKKIGNYSTSNIINKMLLQQDNI